MRLFFFIENFQSTVFQNRIFLPVAVLLEKTALHFLGTAWALLGNQVFSKRGSYPKTVLFPCRSAIEENRFALFRHCLGTFGEPEFLVNAVLIPKPYFLLVAAHFLKTASHFSGTAWVLSGNQVFIIRAPNQGFCGLPIYPKTGRDIPLSFSHHHLP